ncbi:MAG: TIR domain-containing protein [Capsulimonadaceae bacterium]
MSTPVYDVFVSYRRREPDQGWALDLVRRLQQDGYKVAIDIRDFRPNENFLIELERCVVQSRFTVAVVSARYLEGNTDEELVIAKVLDMSERTRRIIRLDYETVELPVWLYALTGIDWNFANDLVGPYEKLKAALGPPLVAPPAGGIDPNPFLWRGPITESAAFFCREREQHEIKTCIKKGTNCQIVGDPRIGKTSLLFQVRREVASWLPSAVVAYTDMQHPACYTLDGFLEVAGRQFGFPDEPRSLRDFANGTHFLIKHRKVPILCIDEFDELIGRRSEFTRDVFLTLRSCSTEGMPIITSSRKPLRQLTDPGDSTSPFYNIFHLMRMDVFSPHDASDFVTIDRPGVTPFTAYEKGAILEFSRNHPLALQVACYHAIESRTRREPFSIALYNARDEMRALIPEWSSPS